MTQLIEDRDTKSICQDHTKYKEITLVILENDSNEEMFIDLPYRTDSNNDLDDLSSALLNQRIKYSSSFVKSDGMFHREHNVEVLTGPFKGKTYCFRRK